jgi:hypothetical protein
MNTSNKARSPPDPRDRQAIHQVSGRKAKLQKAPCFKTGRMGHAEIQTLLEGCATRPRARVVKALFKFAREELVPSYLEITLAFKSITHRRKTPALQNA